MLAADAIPTFTVTADGGWADAGNGAMKVVGSSVADIIYLGLGTRPSPAGGWRYHHRSQQ